MRRVVSEHQVASATFYKVSCHAAHGGTMWSLNVLNYLNLTTQHHCRTLDNQKLVIVYNGVQFKPADRDKLCFHDHIMWSADNIHYHAKGKLSWYKHSNPNDGVYNKNTLKRKDRHYLLYVTNSDMLGFYLISDQIRSIWVFGLHETNKKCNIIIMNLIFSITMRPF